VKVETVKIEFYYETGTEYMICPPKVGKNLRKLQSDFDKWLYNRQNNHPFWELAYIDEEGIEFYEVCFNADAFVNCNLIDIPNKTPKKTIRF